MVDNIIDPDHCQGRTNWPHRTNMQTPPSCDGLKADENTGDKITTKLRKLIGCLSFQHCTTSKRIRWYHFNTTIHKRIRWYGCCDVRYRPCSASMHFATIATVRVVRLSSSGPARKCFIYHETAFCHHRAFATNAMIRVIPARLPLLNRRTTASLQKERFLS